jgi:hypothetical protein
MVQIRPTLHHVTCAGLTGAEATAPGLAGDKPLKRKKLAFMLLLF